MAESGTTSTASTSATEGHASGKYKTEVAVAWTLVAIPLVYGVYHAVKAALQLFGG
ncbi:hypothetical protein ACFQ07_11755 [Actinomadura adrarensis]|uniref:Uncharacterized protein n=1 Tax=Actinomadura adrarensis TaxID=1819600 RepID=A0ABW3CGN6_9ACTN